LLREATTLRGIGWKVRSSSSDSRSSSTRRARAHTGTRTHGRENTDGNRDIPSGGASDRQMNRLIELVDESVLRRAL